MNKDLKTRKAFFPVNYSAKEDNGEKTIEGYFIVYNHPTELEPGFIEEVLPGACSKSIRSNDICALYNHNSDIVLGRNQSGTLRLEEDAKGVKGIVSVNPNDIEALNVYERVKRGDIAGCSFGFDSMKERYEHLDNGVVKAVVSEIDFYEVSVCPFPAYPQTSIEARRKNYGDYTKQRLNAAKNKAKERLLNVIGNIKDEQD